MTTQRESNVLIVDDRPENLLALEKLLSRPDLNIVKADSGNNALALILEYDFALVLMDVQMPDMDGFETAELMRGDDDTKHIPIIFVTAINKEQQHVFRGYETGAVDYLFKPLDPEILLSKVNVFLELHEQRQALKRANDQLAAANQRILEQQEKVVQKERLEVLLQMAGATAHELSQPLMGLMGSIELLELGGNDPKRREQHLQRIKTAGKRISEVVHKIQTLRRDEIKPYFDNSSIINFDQSPSAE